MKVHIQVWSDNHGKDETFGTKPNQPRSIYKEIVEIEYGANLLGVVIDSLRKNLMKKSPNEPITILARNDFGEQSGLEEVRLEIANQIFVCQAVVCL